MIHFKKIFPLFLFMLISSITFAQSTLVHPGLSHKQSDLDRMKYMVKAEIDPWFTSFNNLKNDGNASFNYAVRGNPSMTVITQDGTNYSAFSGDVIAAYLNSLMWAITGDERHAEKCVEIFNAWVNITEFTGGGTESLNAGRVIWKLLEAAEIIRHTYDGWVEEDIKKFEDMLVYPGYSTTEVPPTLSNTNGTFYWRMYQGDPGRHGNQDMFGMRGVMAMGVFLDNEIMFERALRYFMGLPHREDDLPYVPGPRSHGNVISENEYFIFYDAAISDTVPDYGYNGVLEYFIWENGQLQESSRDQDHGILGLGMTASMAEIAWNQGVDVYSLHDNRILTGYEFSLRYNVSYQYAFSDQPEPWEPTVESGEFIQRSDRTGRWFSKKINPHYEGDFVRISRGNFKSDKRPIYELPIAHYRDRMGYPEEDLKWTIRANQISIDEVGYEKTGWSHDHLGWGALTARRPDNCPGDPVSYVEGQPVFGMNLLPGTVEAEDFDFFTADGEGRTYHDETESNGGGEYRTDESVDIEVCSEGGYNLTDLDAGEWFSYTVNVPLTREYDIEVRYAAQNEGGQIKVTIGDTDVTGSVALPATGSFASWETFTVGSAIPLEKGVHNLRIYVEGTSDAFLLNSFSVGTTVNINPSVQFLTPHIGAGFVAASDVTFEVEASDLDGDITNVEFYLGEQKIGEDATVPYTYIWEAVPAGDHVLTAKGIDNDGGESSVDVEIKVYDAGQDLVLYYNLNHNAEDISGNMLNATVSGNALYASGLVNSSIMFNGGEDHLELPANIFSGVGDFTVAAWVNLDEVEPFSPVFDFSVNTSTYMTLVPNPVTNKTRFTITDGSLNLQMNAPAELPKNEWVHLAVTLFDEKGMLFINGELVDTHNTMTINPSDLGELTKNYIGKSQFSSVPNLTGKIDDFKIYKRALNESEVMEMYVTGLVDVSRPEISLTSPSENDEFVEGNAVTLMAEASDPNGTISKVEFYERRDKIGESLAAPYSLTMDDLPVGEFIYSAIATDNEGNTQTTNHQVILVQEYYNEPPAITIITPQEGTEFTIDETIQVTMEASDANGTISKVDLFVDGTLQEDIVSLPFETTVQLTAPGDHELVAVATDNEGAMTTSDTVSITVSIPLSIHRSLEEIKVYPNPAGDAVYLNFSNLINGDIHYKIFNMAGTLVCKGSFTSGIQRIPLHDVPKGIYLLQLAHQANMYQMKFIKE